MVIQLFSKDVTLILTQKRGRQLLAQYGYFFLMWFVIQVFYNVPIKNLTSGWLEEGLLDLVKLITWLGIGSLLIRKTAPAELAVAHPFRVNLRQRVFYITLALVVGYLVISATVQQHTLHVVDSFRPTMLFQDFLIVGLCEETLFRGYFLNRLRPLVSNNQTALIIQAVLFAGIHLPRYLTTYPSLSLITITSNLITVGLLGYLFGWLFLKTKSLWPGIIVHSVWDLLIVLIVGGN